MRTGAELLWVVRPEPHWPETMRTEAELLRNAAELMKGPAELLRAVAIEHALKNSQKWETQMWRSETEVCQREVMWLQDGLSRSEL